MVWILGSLIILGVFVAAIASVVRHRPADAVLHIEAGGMAEDTLARRVRRIEDDLDDMSGQLTQLREDVQYLMRQLEDRD